LHFYRTRIVCHWIIYGYAPMTHSFVYRSFVSCIMRSFVCVFRIFRSFVHLVYRAFSASFVWSVRSFWVRFVCVLSSFAFGAYCKLIRSRICNNEDAAKIRSAIARASRERWSAKPYERRSPPISTATGTGRGQNQLFRSKQCFNNNNNNSCFAPGSCFICHLPGHSAKHCSCVNRQSTTRTTSSATESRQVEYAQSSKQ
jgi:hypothetical protein